MLLDPSSREYKRARRHHYKTTKNRNGDTDPDWTPFRAEEKKYKARFPPPDLSGALDLALLDASRHADIEQTGWKGRPDVVPVKEIDLDDAQQKPGAGTRRAFAVVDVPGLVILPAFVSDEAQRDLIRWSLRDHAKYPNETNLDTHYILPHSGLWSTYLSSPETVVQPQPPSSETLPNSPGPRRLVSNTPASPATFSLITSTPKPSSVPSAYSQPISTAQLIPRLRWANIGWSYHWGTKQYDFAREVQQPVGEPVRRVCLEAVRSICWQEVFGGAATELLDGWEGASEWRTWQETYEPDAGIVNFYQIKDSLMGHVDRSEICATSPLVSISLGNAAIFLVGGLTRDVVPIPILLRSGDIVVMSGPACRRAYHGVPRILEGTLPTYLDEGDTVTGGRWTPYARYMRTARVNINVRQVFPSGFDPRLAQA